MVYENKEDSVSITYVTCYLLAHNLKICPPPLPPFLICCFSFVFFKAMNLV